MFNNDKMGNKFEECSCVNCRLKRIEETIDKISSEIIDINEVLDDLYTKF